MGENRIALLGIIIESGDAVERVNALLHDFAPYVVGRMGIPYQKKDVSVISVVLDAPTTAINSLTGKIGMVKGVSAKALYSNK